ncbi:MAG: peptidylprolyl isomerase [Opitutus sp.]
MHAQRRFTSPFLWTVFLLLALGAFSGCRRAESHAVKMPLEIKSSGGKHAVMETDKGNIEFELFELESPTAVENFRLLAERGYYNGLTFHRVVKGFMLQGGDPQGTGEGGESAWGGTFPDQIDRSSPTYKNGYHRGILAMANSGPNTNGSQFFIMHQDYSLPPSYVMFGQVIKGIEVVDAIAATPTTMGPDGNRSRPTTPQVIKKITILP